MAAVGSLAAVLLAGLVFWGLDSDRGREKKADRVKAAAVAPSPAIKTPPSPLEEKRETGRNTMDPAPHPPRNEVEKGSRTVSAEDRMGSQAAQPGADRLGSREVQSRVEGGDKPGAMRDAAPEPSSTSSATRSDPPAASHRVVAVNDQSPGGGDGLREGKAPENAHSGSANGSAKGERLALNVAPQPKPEPPANSLPPREFSFPPLARVAIVIDDLGRDVDVARTLAEIPIPITFSVLPFQNHSGQIIALARAKGREVMLHMPMEPEGYPQVNPGRGALLVSMGSRDIEKNLRMALDETPHVRGINNHMGSRFTEQTEPMAALMKELQRRRLYFLDSATTVRSVAMDAAQSHGVPYLRRDVFLDHVLAESFVRAQIGQLIRRARVQGVALAIGHPHEVTVKVLKEESATFERERIAVVPASQLLSVKTSRVESR